MSQLTPQQIYAELRNKALIEYPPILAKDPRFLNSPAVGAIMETSYPNATATLVAFIDGACSIYFSRGGGFIGGEGHANVRIGAKRFTQFAGALLAEMSPTAAFPPPPTGTATFYVMTPKGVFTTTGPENELGQGTHPFAPLFHSGHYLIAQLRAATEKKKG